MTPAPHVLLLEDSPLDAELTIAHLEEAGLGAQIRWANSREEFIDALNCGICDLVLADYDLPNFDGFEALQLAIRHCPDVPFIFLSGKLGEEHAIDSLRQGATDYVLKQRMERLVPSVRRALAEKREREERRQAERRLEESERRFRQLANMIPQLAWWANPTGDVTWFNDRWYTYTGTTPEQMLGWGWESVHDPQYLPRVVEAWKQALRTGESFEMEFPIRGADGRFRIFLTRCVPLRDFEGRIVQWLGTNTDIEDLRRAQIELAAEKGVLVAIANGRPIREVLELLARSIESQSDAGAACVVTVAREEGGPIHGASPAMPGQWVREMTTRELDLEIAPWNQKRDSVVCIPDMDADERCAAFRPLARAHGLRGCFSTPIHAADGRFLGTVDLFYRQPGPPPQRDRDLTASATRLAAVAIERFGAERHISHALDAERHAREHAEMESRLKDEFLATLSHELRTPLNAILGWAQLLNSGPMTPEDLRDGVSVIERNARTQSELVSDLLDMSRIISGKLRLDVQRVDLATVIESAIETVRPAADARQVRISRVINPMAGNVAGDPGRLQQVVWNLLTNAVKFTPRGGEVNLILERVGSQVRIIVRDTGEGIAPEFLPHVFDRFRQADATTTRHHGGLGLGLSIVKHLVELHGGTVAAESAGPGKGAAFTVTLPVAPLRADALEQPKSSSRQFSYLASGNGANGSALKSERCPDRLDGIRVLVVDDDLDARELMRRVLGACGAEVILASDAREAILLLREHRPAVVVSDIGMPDYDGYALIRWIRDLPAEQGGKTPALALTAFARSDDRRRAIAAGFQLHLSKPAEPAELVTMIGSLAGAN